MRRPDHVEEDKLGMLRTFAMFLALFAALVLGVAMVLSAIAM